MYWTSLLLTYYTRPLVLAHSQYMYLHSWVGLSTMMRSDHSLTNKNPICKSFIFNFATCLAKPTLDATATCTAKKNQFLTMMKTTALALLAGSAAAFAPAQSGRASTAQSAGIDDLKDIAGKCNPAVKVGSIFM